MDILRVIKRNRILVVIFLVALVLRIVFVFSTPVRIWDETVYLGLGYDLSNNPFDYSFARTWSDYIPSGGDDFYGYPKAGFRAPLLPYIIALIYFINFDFLVNFILPIIGALSVILIFFLCNKLFDYKTGLIAALLFALMPLHVFYSSRVLTEVLCTFFILLTFISFWKGYERNNAKHKVLFGVFLALALLSRYTALWIMPVFLIYFLIRDKSLKFLKDKYLWYSILAFFIVLIPWFIYGFFEYNNIFGAFVHGFKASGYWGGLQSWNFFFNYWIYIFSITGIIFIFALIHIFYKKSFVRKEIYLLLIWFAFFFGMAIYMPHKEDRFIIPIAPVIAIISAYFLNKIKRYRKIIFLIIIIISLASLGNHFYQNYSVYSTNTNKCFLEANKFLAERNSSSVVITDESPVVYYYTKLGNHFYPEPFNYESVKILKKIKYSTRDIYVIFGDYIIKSNEEMDKIKNNLNKDFERVFICEKGESYSYVYKFID